MDVDRQRRGCLALGEPDVEDLSLVVAVFHVGVGGWVLSFCLFCFGAGSRAALLLCPSGGSPNDSLLFRGGKTAVTVRVGLREALQDCLVQSRFLCLGQLAVSILVGLRLQLEDLFLQGIVCGDRCMGHAHQDECGDCHLLNLNLTHNLNLSSRVRAVITFGLEFRWGIWLKVQAAQGVGIKSKSKSKIPYAMNRLNKLCVIC